MLGSYVPSCQRNWYKLCCWNVRTDKERYTGGKKCFETPYEIITYYVVELELISIRKSILGLWGLKSIWKLSRWRLFFRSGKEIKQKACSILNAVCHVDNWMMSLIDMNDMCLHTLNILHCCMLKMRGKQKEECFMIIHATRFLQAVLNSGHSINISSQPAWQNSGNGGVSVFQSRITR